MTLTALVGALVALVARPKEPQRTKDQEEIERLKRSHAQLIDRIETLELENEGLNRELAAERNLLTHWIGEAGRFAREAREQREMWERREGYQAQQDPRQAQQNVAFQGFCNCVPSRGQVFDALVEQLNQLGR
jgi:gas vesicle protein